jgi:hypothetical protein
MSYQDTNPTCCDCNRHFTLSAVEQALGGELGYDEPKRCRTCWQSREDARSSARSGQSWLLSPRRSFRLSPQLLRTPARSPT